MDLQMKIFTSMFLNEDKDIKQVRCHVLLKALAFPIFDFMFNCQLLNNSAIHRISQQGENVSL